MHTLFRLVFIISAAILISADALGLCMDGRHPSVQDEYKASDFVVLGLVTGKRDISSPDDPQGIDKTIYDVKVVRRFKGSHRPILKISSENTSSRFPMVVGTKYLIFVRLFSGEAIVDSCGNSGEIENRKVEIDALAKASHEK